MHDTNAAIDKPWLSHKDWNSRIIHSDAKDLLYGVWILMILWNLISIPAATFAISKALNNGNDALWFVAIFPIIGIGILFWAIKTTHLWRVIGAAPLTMDPYPGSIGGQVGGSIELNIPYGSQLRFPLSLNCLCLHEDPGSDFDRTDNKWQTEGFAHAEPSGAGTRLNFCFNVPANLPESEYKSKNYHMWQLNLKGHQAAVNIERNFNLPVFNTQEQSQYIHIDSGNNPQVQQESEARIQSVVTMTQIPGGIELFNHAGHLAATKLAFTVFGLFFFVFGIIASILSKTLMIPVIFVLIGAGISLGSFYSLLNTLQVRIGQQGLHTRRRLLGFIIGQHSIAAAEIKELHLHDGGSVNNGTEHKNFFSVKAHLRNGEKITIAKNLLGQATAALAAEKIARLSGFCLCPFQTEK